MHSHTVGISPESILVVKVLDFKVDSDFVSNIWIVRETKELDVNIKNIKLVVEGNVNSSLFVVSVRNGRIITVRTNAVVKDEFRSDRASKEFDALQLRVSDSLKLILSCSEDIVTTRLSASILLTSPIFEIKEEVLARPENSVVNFKFSTFIDINTNKLKIHVSIRDFIMLFSISRPNGMVL